MACRAKGETLAGQALGRADWLVVVVLAPTLPCLLVAVRVEPVVDIALARAAHRIAPPLCRARLLHLFLTVAAAEKRGVALALVAVLRVFLSGAS